MKSNTKKPPNFVKKSAKSNFQTDLLCQESCKPFWFFISIKYDISLFVIRLIVGTLIHICAISSIKYHVRFVDCSVIYADLQRLFVFKTFEFGANFGPRRLSLGFEFETIHGKFVKRWTIQPKIGCHILAELAK